MKPWLFWLAGTVYCAVSTLLFTLTSSGWISFTILLLSAAFFFLLWIFITVRILVLKKSGASRVGVQKKSLYTLSAFQVIALLLNWGDGGGDYFWQHSFFIERISGLKFSAQLYQSGVFLWLLATLAFAIVVATTIPKIQNVNRV